LGGKYEGGVSPVSVKYEACVSPAGARRAVGSATYFGKYRVIAHVANCDGSTTGGGEQFFLVNYQLWGRDRGELFKCITSLIPMSLPSPSVQSNIGEEIKSGAQVVAEMQQQQSRKSAAPVVSALSSGHLRSSSEPGSNPPRSATPPPPTHEPFRESLSSPLDIPLVVSLT